MQSTPFAPPPSRTAPCPCGSGRRYKECHGALGARNETAAPIASPAERMHAALTAQRANRLREAATLYRSVLEENSANFDALHMLGVIEYELGNFTKAESLVVRALGLLPNIASAHGNLQLIREGRKRAEAEQQLCRELLPQLTGVCASSPPSFAARTSPSVAAVLGCGVGETSLTRQLSALEAAGTAVRWWRWRDGPPAPALSVRVAEWDGAQRLPQFASLLLIGTEISAAPWVAGFNPSRVMLLAGSGPPCRLADRIRELSDEAKRKVELIYLDAATVMAQLPGLIAPIHEPGRWWRAHLDLRP